jgi:hypothetical protein
MDPFMANVVTPFSSQEFVLTFTISTEEYIAYTLRPSKSVAKKPYLSHKHTSRTTLFLGRSSSYYYRHDFTTGTSQHFHLVTWELKN